ncbi:hypothetical protein E4T56_gene4946 [Termitomyces sp. T112]|nr:hypothetical protein E4T56_gene4946 [Termitomyces sp. T112]
MGTVVERIPYDVWLHISTFLPRNVVENLYGVNSSFLKVSTAARYGVLTFSKHDKLMKRLWRHLSDPSKGVFVHEVNIDPWVVQPSLKPSFKQGGNLCALIDRIFDPQFDNRQLEQRVQKRLRKDIRRVIDAISVMPNLYRYSLGWKDDQAYHPELYRAFLAPVLSCIKDNLRSLSLNVPPELLHTLPSVYLPRLESLSVDLCTKEKSEEEIDRIFDSFVVFVNNLLGSLESLSISSRVPSRSLRLDRFFRMLGTFPHMRRFSLSIPFDGIHLRSSDELVKFLNKHRYTLNHLRLSASRCSPLDSPADPESKFWIRNTFTHLNTPYPYLRDLHLAIRPIRVDLTPLMKFLELHTLESLTLTERALTYSEVKAILDALRAYEHSNELKQLCLKLKHLTPALFELLATRVPRLALLELIFDDIVATAVHTRSSASASDPAHPIEDEFRLFVDEIKKNRVLYASWGLVTLKLFQESSDRRVKDLFEVFADCIPAIQNYVDLTPESFNHA